MLYNYFEFSLKPYLTQLINLYPSVPKKRKQISEKFLPDRPPQNSRHLVMNLIRKYLIFKCVNFQLTKRKTNVKLIDNK